MTVARPQRLEFPGALWYVTSRGVEDEAIVHDDDDRARLLEVLAGVVTMMRWRLHAWAIVDSRFELLVETPEPNLAAGMRQLNGIYTQAFNRRHDRSGPIFFGRYKSVLVDRESYFLPVARAVALLPSTEGEVRRIPEIRWSNYRMTTLAAEAPEWFDVMTTLRLFDARNRARSVERYRAFLAEGKKATPLHDEIRHQMFLGSDAFIERMQHVSKGKSRARAASQRGDRSVWRPEMRAIVRSVAEVYATTEHEIERSRGGEPRSIVAYLGRYDAAQSLAEVGRTLRLGDAAVSRLSTVTAERFRDDETFARRVAKVRATLMRRAGR